MIDISIIVPMHNEAVAMQTFFATLLPILDSLKRSYEILCIDDGSKDNTLHLLKDYSAANPCIKIISFSRNFGKESALTAGLQYASGAVVIPIDADLQDPPEVIPAFIEKWEAGYDVVYGIRQDRSSDSWLKKTTAQLFYGLFNRITPPEVQLDSGDYRLMTRRVVEAVLLLPERDRFMKGIFSWVGFSSIGVPYSRQKRCAGQTSWNYFNLLNFAISGICSFSTIPLRFWSYLGVFMSFAALLYAVFVAFKKIFYGDPVPGYPSMMVTILFMGGIQLLSLGIIGEYLGRLSKEIKQRPLFIVSELVNLAPRSPLSPSADQQPPRP